MRTRSIATLVAQAVGFALLMKMVVPQAYSSTCMALFVICMPAVYWGFAVAHNNGRVDPTAELVQETLILACFGAGVAYMIHEAPQMAALGVLAHAAVDVLHVYKALPCGHHVPGNYAVVCAIFDVVVAATWFALQKAGVAES